MGSALFQKTRHRSFTAELKAVSENQRPQLYDCQWEARADLREVSENQRPLPYDCQWGATLGKLTARLDRALGHVEAPFTHRENTWRPFNFTDLSFRAVFKKTKTPQKATQQPSSESHISLISKPCRKSLELKKVPHVADGRDSTHNALL
ncbi:hypothetical protein RRG08_061146 [Elysia crispata]|uniref:Uncharacterized protein n=1 Tax=Elysia crispata TaxID=231223 RepID=A0AAE1CED9_9GAST|nr:hypothetical protein RRG08_061146 [Elysia crispata]